MAYMTASIARSVAESKWGRGGTKSYRTNRKGVYYFSCAGHGGYVLPASVLTDEEYESVVRYVSPHEADVYYNSNKVVYMHPFRSKGGRISYPYETAKEKFFLFEEDCDWAVLEKFTGIRLKNYSTNSDYQATFWAWFDENNPVVKNRKEVEQKRKNGDPDLITSASRQNDGTVAVFTADEKRHIVTEYNRDEYGVPYLSLCKLAIQELAA